jgi:hypothetical protein
MPGQTQGPRSIKTADTESPAPNPEAKTRCRLMETAFWSSEQMVTGIVAELEFP